MERMLMLLRFFSLIFFMALFAQMAKGQTDSNAQQAAGLGKAVQTLVASTTVSRTTDKYTPSHAQNELTAIFVSVPGGISITYDWDAPAASAAFIRNNELWVVFDRPISVKHSAIDPKVKLRLQKASQSLNAQATVLHYKLSPGQWAGIERTGTHWTVHVKDTEILPRILLTTEVANDTIAAGAVSIPVATPSNVVTIADEVLGDVILVAPVNALAQGFAKASMLRGGELLQTAQGIAFVPLSRRYALIRQDKSILITDSAISVSSGSSSTFVRSSVGSATARLIDFENWAIKDGRKFEEIEGDLLYKLSVANVDEQQKKRWLLATFYLARGLPQRAYGVMEAMVRKEKQIEQLPQFRAARGVAALESHNYAAAREDLLDMALDGVNEIWLWRTKLHDIEGRPQAAIEAYQRGSDVISYYAPAERGIFQLAVIRSAILLGNGGLAQQELGLLPLAEMLPAQKAEAHYWQGRLAALQGHMPEALRIYKSISAGVDRRSHAMAQLSATQILVKNSGLKLTLAIAALERMRYAWRGDTLELELLDTLATYYTQSRRYREALISYRQAISYFTPNERTRTAVVMQDNLFRSLFLDGVADTLAPVQTLALFTDFKDLTPLGTDGDLMIRRLSERLVDVELYNRAADLLEHQVRYRLEGTAQAVVALRLAMVQILAGKPQAALDAIRFTRTIAINDDVLASRNRIEARALIDLEDFEAADVLLDQDSSPTAQILQADLAWTRKDWRKLTAITNDILAVSSQSPAISASDRIKHILRLTFAQNMLNNVAALKELRIRYAALMTGGGYEQAFALLASGNSLGPADIRNLSKTLVNIDRLDSFRDVYRAELRSMDIPLTTTASLTPEQAAALTPAAGKAAKR
jgi:tetratricopeptide (TPR) repeat protein